MPRRLPSALLVPALILAAFATGASAAAETQAPARPATRPAAVRLPPQDPAVPAPKFGRDGQPDKRFLELHEKFLARAKQGDVGIVFLGDSITQGWGNNEVWRQHYEPLKAANFGIGGDRTQHVLWRIVNGELEGIAPKVAVIMIGTNNTGSDPADKIAEGVTAIVKTVRAKLPNTKVLLLGVFPRGQDPERSAAVRAKIRAINETIAKLDDGKTVRYLDLTDKFLEKDGTISKDVMPDFLHLSKKGYTIWAEGMKPLLDEMMK